MDKETDNKRIVGQPSAETIIIEKRLRKLEEGESVSYDDLNALIPGGNIQTKHRYCLSTSIKRLEKEGIFIRTVIGNGVIRVTHDEEVSFWSQASDHIRRVASRRYKRIANADYDKLKSQNQTQYNIGMSVLSGIAAFLKPKKLSLISDIISEQKKAISFDETIKLFADK